MRRDDTIRRIPQRTILGQRFRIRDIQRRTPQPAFLLRIRSLLQRGDQIVLLEDLTAGDVGDEGIFAAEDGEFFFSEKMRGFFGQGDGDEEVVDVLGEEMVQRCFIHPAVPGARDRAVRVTGPGNDEAIVSLTLGRSAWRRGIGNHIRTHSFKYPRRLPSDTAVAEDAEALTNVIADGAQATLLPFLTPFV